MNKKVLFSHNLVQYRERIIIPSSVDEEGYIRTDDNVLIHVSQCFNIDKKEQLELLINEYKKLRIDFNEKENELIKKFVSLMITRKDLL